MIQKRHEALKEVIRLKSEEKEWNEESIKDIL